MKKLFYLVILLSFVSCQSGTKNTNEQEPAVESAQIVETTINVGGMHCDMCVNSIEKGVKELDGIAAVTVSLNDSTAVVSYDTKKVDLAQIEKAIEKRGYSVKGEL